MSLPSGMVPTMPYRDRSDQAAAARRHYAANRSKVVQRSVEWKRRQRQLLREYVAAAKAVPCADCRNCHPPHRMQFDHLRDKTADIAWMMNRPVSLARLQAEIAKCEVVCSNCHTDRTHARRLAGEQQPRQDPEPTLF